MKRPLRVVVAKIGLDGHDRGAKVIAAGFRDAGFEVIYTGIRQTPKKVAAIANQEDADVIAVSILSGAHNKLCGKLMELLKEQQADDIVCLVGGIIPNRDIEYLKSIGYAGVFTPGSELGDIVNFVKEKTKDRNQEYSL
ncbi:cobalamin B12-binding domain-containing protein [Neobacillus novalis]|uniref:Cobalamin B12-binding domain-containing protein n=1 Tax=Neobacillus novalis TaxID=220687 RepID=A0AA95S987_9BACI|nr:cobalamin B12-binding domain-containing protein [Neobacillus novalis]WHY83984.1 cobalamin B12-binding domain-containing protein [Neobacillus novalis]